MKANVLGFLEQGTLSPWQKAVFIVVGVCTLFFVASVPMNLEQQAIFGLLVYCFAMLIKGKKHRVFTILLVALSILISTRYIYWRLTESLVYESTLQIFFASGLVAAELYAFIVLLLGYFQTIWPLDRMPVKLPKGMEDWPTVDIYIPSYNEPLKVVRPTVLGAMNLDWPKDKLNIYLLDDGRREEFGEFCAEVGITHITRTDNNHAKAGNINAALPQTDGDYIAIFDCDHIPSSTFLKLNMGFFMADEKLALVQTPHHFYSPDPFERNLNTFRKVPNEGELFYGLLQGGNDFWNAAFFCGSCALIRRDMLLEVGGIAVETVTEDAHTALKLHSLGYHSAFCSIAQAGGLATESVSAHVGQRIRWGRGMAQIFRTDNPLFKKGLELGQRLCYFNGMFHFFYGLPRIIFLTAPLGYLFLDLHIINASALMIAAFVLPHLMLSTLTNSRIQGHVRHSFWAEVYETVMSPYLLRPTLMALINPKLGKFNVTEKGGLVEREYFDKDIAKPLVVMLGLDIVGLIVGIVRLFVGDASEVQTLVLNLIWTVYNIMILAAALGVCMETKQVRLNHRVPVSLTGMLRFASGHTLRTQTIDMSEGGLSFKKTTGKDFPLGSHVNVVLFSKEQEYVFEGEIAHVFDDRYCISFEGMALEKERDLIEVLFCRPSSWRNWADEREDDKPLKSLLTVLYKGFEGTKKITASTLPGGEGMKNMLSLLKSRFWKRSRDMGAGLLIITAATMTSLPQSVEAAVVNESSLSTSFVSEKGAASRIYTLKMLGADEDLRILGVDGRQSVSFGVRNDEVITGAKLNVQYSYSPALLDKISQINVLLNGYTVASFPVGKKFPAQGSIKLDLNPYRLTEYNTISFQLIGHYTITECEYPNHTSLWAVISNLSTLTLKAQKMGVKNDLARLPEPFFDSHDKSTLVLPMVFAGDVSLGSVKAAGVVASWFGKHADYRGAEFPVLRGQLPERGNAVVFITDNSDIKGLDIGGMNGAKVAVRSNPRDPLGHLLLVMGRDTNELLEAAIALSLGKLALSGSNAQVLDVEMPPLRKPYDAPHWLVSDRAVSFGELVESGALQVEGGRPDTIRVGFKFPPDLFDWGNFGADIALRYRYSSPPLDGNARFNINFNNKFIESVALEGAAIDKSPTDWMEKTAEEWLGREVVSEEDFVLPSAWFGFDNQFQFQYYLEDAVGKCREVPGKYFRGRIEPDSSIDISNVPHFTKMPNIGLFSNAGFPFTRVADLAETAVIFANKVDNDSIYAFLELMGMMGRATGYPVIRVAVDHINAIEKYSDRDILMIGSLKSENLFSRLSEFMPIDVSDGRLKLKDLSMMQYTKNIFTGSKRERDFEQGGELILSSGGNLGVITGFESPWEEGRSIIVVTAAGDRSLKDVADNIVGNPALKKVYADTIFLLEKTETSEMYVLKGKKTVAKNKENKISSGFYSGNILSKHKADSVLPFHFAESYYAGDLPFWTWLRWYCSNSPWALFLLSIFGMLVLAAAVYVLMRNRAKRRLRAGSKDKLVSK